MKGIIYKYTSPSGKVYIGQTLNEKRRRKEFLNLNNKYGGSKIDFARQKYKTENFIYEILFSSDFDTVEEANIKLNEMEIYYIELYDSVKNGYNISLGGDSIRGVMLNDECKQRMIDSLKNFYKTHQNPFKGRHHTEETKKILSEKAKGRPSPFKGRHWDEEHRKQHSEALKGRFTQELNPFYGKKHNDETKRIIGEKNSKSVVQIDMKTNEILAVFSSAKKAALSLGKENGSSQIIQVCKKYIKPCGRRILSAFGYKWKYLKDIEGSTTTEKTSKDGTE